MKRAFRALGILLVFVVAGLSLSGFLYKPDVRIPDGFKGRYITVAGNRLRYFQAGAGPDVLLIHGCPGSIEDWDPIIKELSPKFRVTAYDRPGHGYSGVEGALYTLDQNADVALSLIEALGLHDVVVVGHSFGGGTALAMAVRNPPRVKSYVDVDGIAYGPSRGPDPLYYLLSAPGVGVGFARTIAPLVAPKKIGAGLLANFPANAVPDGFIETRIRIWMQPKVFVSIARETLGASKGLAEVAPRYKEIKRPVFIVDEADDPLPLRREHAERLHREIPASELFPMSGSGHYIQFTRASELAGIIEKAGAAPSAGK